MMMLELIAGFITLLWFLPGMVIASVMAGEQASFTPMVVWVLGLFALIIVVILL